MLPLHTPIHAAKGDYAEGLKRRVRAAAPHSVIIETFLNPGALSKIYQQTRLNFHVSLTFLWMGTDDAAAAH